MPQAEFRKLLGLYLIKASDEFRDETTAINQSHTPKHNNSARNGIAHGNIRRNTDLLFYINIVSEFHSVTG